MKKTTIILIAAATIGVIILGGCRRNYEVNYAHVAVDTTRLNHADADTAPGIYDGHLFELPDAPAEVTVSDIMSSDSREAAREAELFFSGEE